MSTASHKNTMPDNLTHENKKILEEPVAKPRNQQTQSFLVSCFGPRPPKIVIFLIRENIEQKKINLKNSGFAVSRFRCVVSNCKQKDNCRSQTFYWLECVTQCLGTSLILLMKLSVAFYYEISDTIFTGEDSSPLERKLRL